MEFCCKIQKILDSGNLPLVFEGVRNFLKSVTYEEPIVLSCTVGVTSTRHFNTNPDQMALISISTTYCQCRHVPTSDAEASWSCGVQRWIKRKSLIRTEKRQWQFSMWLVTTALITNIFD